MAQLLAELAILTHNARIQRMIELGRRTITNPGLRATIAELERGDVYERFLALMSCHGSRDGAHALRAIDDPSERMRTAAISVVAIVGSDAEVLTALERMPSYLHLKLLWHLRRRRQAVIDRFLATLANDDRALTPLLFFGSASLVQQHIDHALSTFGSTDWNRLARVHPAIAANALQQRAEAATERDPRLLLIANAILPELADTNPDQAMTIVRALQTTLSLGELALNQLILRRPADMADLALQSDDRLRSDFTNVAHRLDTDRLLAIMTQRPALLPPDVLWFRRITPVQRLAIYAQAARGWRAENGTLPEWLVALLSGETRHTEARRNLALPALQTQPSTRFGYAALLPWNEATGILTPFIASPDPDLRVTAQRALVLCARYNPGHLPDLLANIRGRKNEQDPVRMAMIQGLAKLPPSRWQVTHLDDLSQILRDALGAADLSAGTAAAAEQLICAILPFHTAWSAEWLATLMRARGQISFFAIESRINNEQTRQIAPLLLPVLASWATRERSNALIAAAQSFGKRLRVFPELLDLLERTLRDTRSPWHAVVILDLFARHAPERLEQLVPQLLRDDPSWATQPAIYTFLHTKRQDLLTPFLGRKAYSGRFSTGKTRFVLPLLNGFFRWTPAQQRLFASTLQEITRDPQRDLPATLFAINQLAHLPAVPPTRLIELASVNTENIALRDYAVRALGRLDGDQGMQPLLDCLGDDRARVAIYTLRRTLLRMPADRALVLLRVVPMNRVTVAKEVIRLIGDIGSEAGYAELQTIAGQTLHRDVRIALLRALWEHIEREQTWPLLEQAALDSDPAVAAGVVRIPADRATPAARSKLVALMATLLEHPEPQVRTATLARCISMPVEDAEQRLLPPLVNAMQSPLYEEACAAAQAVFAMYAVGNPGVIGTAISALLPHRKSLSIACEAFQAPIHWQRTRILPAVRATLAALAADPLTAILAARLATLALPWPELASWLTGAATTGLLHADTLAAAQQSLAEAVRRSDANTLSTLEQALGASDNAHLRRLGVAALVAGAADSNGWTDERLARLANYHADPAPLVAAAAQFTFPAGH